MTLTVGSLFSGIGGLDLGLERAGMRVIWQSEIDPYASRVLKKHWPEVVNHGNIKEINWQEIERPDVICGGYPCQPFSTAGKRRGEEDPRHLWPWVKQAISELRPRYAILENVRGHLSMGGLSVIGELAAIGYDAEWRVVSAASVGANHRRDRIIIVAYPNSSHPADGRQREDVPSQNRSWGNDGSGSGSNLGEISVGSTRQNSCNVADTNCRRCKQCKPQTQSLQGLSGSSERNLADTNCIRLEGQRPQQQTTGTARGSQNSREPVADTQGCNGGSKESHFIPTVFGQATELRKQSSFFRPINDWWQIEPGVGRVANGIPSRVDRLKGLGNAVVPQVAEVIGRLVVAHSCS